MRRHKKRHLMRVILFSTVNYCSFAHGDVSIRFNGKNDNVVLEYIFPYVEVNMKMYISIV